MLCVYGHMYVCVIEVSILKYKLIQGVRVNPNLECEFETAILDVE